MHTRKRTHGKTRQSAVALAVGLSILAVQSNAIARANPCATAAKTQRKSELKEASADFLNALAKAQTNSSITARLEAIGEAKIEYADAIDEARDRYRARLEVCQSLDESYYEPEIDPDNFMTPEMASMDPNPYLPLIPGTTYIYEGETDEGLERVEVTVTDETREIQGVECFVVRDIVHINGELVEDTRDWFAVDTDRNVWYFGEISLNYEDGELADIEGSWEAGEDGAKAGIVMFASPEVGKVYRQEFLLGEAEDIGEVVSLNESVEVVYGAFDQCLQTHDYTPVEPELVELPELKYYAPGVGFILEFDTHSGEVVELVEIIHPE